MSRFVSALKRLPDSHLAQDVCALAAIIAFILAGGFVLAEISDAVSAVRAMR